MKPSNSMRPLVVGSMGICLGLLIGLAWDQRRNAQAPAPQSQQVSRQIGPEVIGQKVSPSRPKPNTLALPTKSTESALEELRALLTRSRITDFAAYAMIVQKLSLQQCPEALKLIFQISNDDRHLLSSLVARRWAELDPEAALEASNNLDDRYVSDVLNAAITELVLRKGDKTLDILEGAVGKRRKLLATFLLPHLALSSPNEVLNYLEQNPDLKRNRILRDLVIAAIGVGSPDQAFELAGNISNKEEKKSLTDQIWSEWILRNPAEASVAIANATFNNEEKVKVWEALIYHWSQKDNYSALAWLEMQSDGELRDQAIKRFVVGQPGVTSEIVDRLMKLSGNTKGKERVARAHAAGLAKQNVQAALQWANTLPEKSVQQEAKTIVYQTWLRESPPEAAQYFLTLKEESNSNVLFQQAVNEWSQDDSDAALKWLQQLPSGETRDHGLVAAVRSARDQDTSTALTFLNQIQDPKSREQATVEVVEKYGAEDGPAAAALAQTISADKQPEAYYSLIRSWGMANKTEAGNWIKTLPPGAPRDSAIKAYVSVIDGDDAGMAVRWASTIQDPTERPEVMMNAFQRWARQDPASAEKWLGEGTVDPAFKPFFEKELKKPRIAAE